MFDIKCQNTGIQVFIIYDYSSQSNGLVQLIIKKADYMGKSIS